MKVLFFLKTGDLTPQVLKELNGIVLKVFTSDPRVLFEKIFVEDNPKLTHLYKITNTPFTIVGDKRFPGIASAEQILRMARQFEEADAPVHLVEGAMTLVTGSAFAKVISAMSGLEWSQRKVLYITKIYPEALARHYGLDSAVMIWLVPRALDGSSVSMNDIPTIGRLIGDFLDKNEKAIIVLEGLETLIKQNPVASVLDMLKALKAKVEQRKATAFVMFLPSAMDEAITVELNTLFSELCAKAK